MNLSDLTALVRKIINDPAAAVLHWTSQPLEEGTGEGVGVGRVTGTAETAHGVIPWRAIRKELSPTVSGPRIEDWNYWRREAWAYESGLLATLGETIHAPRCYAVCQESDNTVSLWIEDLGEAWQSHWEIADYGLAARQLERMNGLFLTERALN